MAPGLLLPFRGSHPMTNPFGPVPLSLEPPAFVANDAGKPWSAELVAYPGAIAHPKVHLGVDYGMPSGTPLYALAAGRIVVRDHDPRGGLFIWVRINGRRTWWYLGHLQSFALPLYAAVTAGELVAHSGASGLVTGPHVHVGVHHEPLGAPRRYYDPRRLFVGGDHAAEPWIVPA